jgi:hypothetical protein
MEAPLRRGELSAFGILPSPLWGGWPRSGRVGVKVASSVSTPTPVLRTDPPRKGEGN